MLKITKNDISKFPYVDIPNWKGNSSEEICFSDWEKKYEVGKSTIYQQFFFFRREGQALICLVIRGCENKFSVGFRQRSGTGVYEEIKYDSLEEAKAKSLEFFTEYFFRKSLNKLEKINKTMKKTRVVNIVREIGIERDPNYVYIGRGSIYGNPFSHLTKRTGALVQVETREESIEKYRQWLNGEVELEIDPPTREEIQRLRGKILGCFCKPQACHGEVLKEIAEEGNREPRTKDLF